MAVQVVYGWLRSAHKQYSTWICKSDVLQRAKCFLSKGVNYFRWVQNRHNCREVLPITAGQGGAIFILPAAKSGGDYLETNRMSCCERQALMNTSVGSLIWLDWRRPSGGQLRRAPETTADVGQMDGKIHLTLRHRRREWVTDDRQREWLPKTSSWSSDNANDSFSIEW